MIKFLKTEPFGIGREGALCHLFKSYPLAKITKREWEEIVVFLLGVIYDNSGGAVWMGLGMLEYQPDHRKRNVEKIQNEIEEAEKWIALKKKHLEELGIFLPEQEVESLEAG